MKDKDDKNVYYLSPRCKKCNSERQVYKSKRILKLIDEDLIQEKNLIL